jgi:hypothetical protein
VGGCFFLPFLSFPFLFFSLFFSSSCESTWCEVSVIFLEDWRFFWIGNLAVQSSVMSTKQEFFSLLIIFSPWNWVGNRKSSINWKRSIYIAFLVSAEFQVGIYKKLSFVGLMITQGSLNLCLAYSSSCRAPLCWFYFNLGLKWLCKSAELFTVDYLFLICTEPLPFRLGKMSTIGKVITCKGT